MVQHSVLGHDGDVVGLLDESKLKIGRRFILKSWVWLEGMWCYKTRPGWVLCLLLEESVTVSDLRELASLFLLCRRFLSFLFFLFPDCSPAALLFRYLLEIFSFSVFPVNCFLGVSLELFS